MGEKEIIVSIIVDEMTIEAKEKYVRNLDMPIGGVDMGGVVEAASDGLLANKLLSLKLLGLSTNINVPVAHFLVRDLTAEELTTVTVHVIREIESATGLKVLRLVADNYSTKVKMFTILNNGVPPTDRVPHPVDPKRWLFVSFPITATFSRTGKISGWIVSS